MENHEREPEGCGPESNKETTASEAKQNESGTFKTPSFIIPSKKKVQSAAGTAEMFKGPEIQSRAGTGLSGSKEEVMKEKSHADSENKTEVNPDFDKIERVDEFLQKAPPKKTAVLSPAEQLSQKQTAIPYKEPSWSTVCEEQFALEVIKNGAIIDNIDLTPKAFHVIGRLPSCDIPMEHPSLSRHHAVLQYSNGNSEQYPKGWYLYDLDSTHGTWINKNKVPSQKHHRIRVDYVLKFGGSSRLFIVKGPDTDREEEAELSATEMKEQREKQRKEAELLRQAEIEEAERKAELLKKREESKGCSWGIDEDEVEEEDESAENPFANIEPENEALYINDPKKALNKYFEREGLDLPEYDFHEAGFGKWKCSVELPIDGPSGEPLVAEVVVSGKKKEAVVACALEACRILDMHGELRKSARESRKRKQRNWEDDDFYDSDEDVYLDRTGAIEKKREQRKNKVGKSDKVTETYDSLLEKHKSITSEIEEIEAKLEQAKAQAAAMESDEIDALDAYMSAIKSGMMDTKTKMKFKRQLLELKQEEQKIRKLVNIAKPATLPDISNKSIKTDVKKTGVLASVGKMKGPLLGKLPRKIVPVGPVEKKTEEGSDEYEEEEEEIERQNENVKRKNVTSETDSNKITESEHRDSGRNLTENQIQSGQSDLQENIKTSESSTHYEKKTENNQKETHSKTRVKGPSLPLAAVLEKLQADENMDETESMDNSEKNKDVGNKRKSKSVKSDSKKMKAGEGDYNTEDPDYAVWLPPENQSGDGKTHLNAKLGY